MLGGMVVLVSALSSPLHLGCSGSFDTDCGR
jgi:hypothetical protein